MRLLGFIIGVVLSMVSALDAADLKVVSMHPLISDLLRKVGKERVEVVDLIGADGDPHSFEPQAKDLGKTEGARLYFVSGMGLENYLSKLKAVLGESAEVVEVGATLPPLYGACDQDDHQGHDHGHELDPHWWHSVDLFRRAADIVSRELSKAAPENREFFDENAKAYRAELDGLEKWVRREVVNIPKQRRQLATSHAAFQYFCEAYGFESYSIQGLNREQMPDAVKLANLIAVLKSKNVAAIFPEKESNPKMLLSLTRDTGIKLGGTLIADGRGMKSYEEMMRMNVQTIIEALR